MEISPHPSTLRQEKEGRKEKEETHKPSTAERIKQTFFQTREKDVILDFWFMITITRKEKLQKVKCE